jgi:hypothetical protein
MAIIVKTGKQITLNAYFAYLRNNPKQGKVTGHLIDGLFPTFKFVVIKRENPKYWTVIEASSGERISTWEKTREDAIRSAQKLLNAKGIDAVTKEIESYIRKRGFVANPEYAPNIINSDLLKKIIKSIDRSKRPTRKRELFEPTKRKISSAKGAKMRNFQPATTIPEPTTTTIKPPQKQSTMANTNALKKYNARVAELVAAGKSRVDARKQASKEVADAKQKAKTKQKAQIRKRNTITARTTKGVEKRLTEVEKKIRGMCHVRKPYTKKSKTTIA